MTFFQKAAIARIISDIIKADNIIDYSEMTFYSEMERKYGLEARHLLEAQKMDFGQAVNTLRDLPKAELKSFVTDMERLTITDGDCAPEEAFLVMALNFSFNPKYNNYCKLITTNVTNLSIDKRNVIYTETEYDEETNNLIRQQLRYITLDFNIAGLDFVYIPRIAKDFNDMEGDYLEQVIRFLAPSLSPERQKEMFHTLRNITTKSFCEDFLVKKMGLDKVYDSEPSILFQVCESNGKIVYMHLSLGEDVLADLSAFVDMYKELTQFNLTPIRHQKASKRFVYHGFHRALFDLLAFPGKKVESRILFDIRKKRIVFVDLGCELKLPTMRMAIYMFIVQQSICGKDINLNATGTRLSVYNRIFSRIYGFMSESDNNDFKSGLTQNLSHIRRTIKEIDLLDNVGMYLPERTADGVLRVKIKPSKVFVLEDGEMIPITESTRWSSL